MATTPVNALVNHSSQYADYFTDASKSKVSMDDFVALLASEMTNQDPLEPMSNTEYVSQLAQFTQLENSQQLLKAQETALYFSNVSYATSMIGKTVSVATTDEDGKIQTDSGVVTGIGFDGDDIIYYVNGKEYSFSNIMLVGEGNTSEPPGDDGDENDAGAEEKSVAKMSLLGDSLPEDVIPDEPLPDDTIPDEDADPGDTIPDEDAALPDTFGSILSI